MQAIVTKFIPPTDKSGPRYQARCQAGRLTIDQRDADGPMGNHKIAAMALVHRLGWADYGRWVAGGLVDGSTVWVCTDPRGMLMFDMRSANAARVD